MQQLTLEHLEWIQNNMTIFTHVVQVDENRRKYIYSMYNHITGEHKNPNGCGRCWLNTKNRVYDQYKKQTNIF
jgi:hypothetical protein